MRSCDHCALRGYSRELCVVHSRHCRAHGADEERAPSDMARLAARVAGGLALGATCALLLSTAASFVGGAPVFHALLPALVVGAGVIGGGLGLFRSLGRRGPLGQLASPSPRRQLHAHPQFPRRSP